VQRITWQIRNLYTHIEIIKYPFKLGKMRFNRPFFLNFRTPLANCLTRKKTQATPLVNDLVKMDMGVQVSNLSSNSLHFVDDIWVRKLRKNGRLKRIFPSLNGYFMISIITEITRRKLFRYASNDCLWIYFRTLGVFKYLRKLLSNGGGRWTPGVPGLNPLLDTSLFYLLVFFLRLQISIIKSWDASVILFQ
jgi:hypothetical protein